MFNKILIANRGEIACRIARTARRMGISTVAVYSQIDASAKHVEMCDEACLIGPAAARDSYLCIDKILQVAISSGAQAIHPGYGFLSENADFAEACEKMGIVFIGPPSSAIRLMGSKSQAKELMSKAGVPLMPGYHGKNQSDSYLRSEADKLGFPLLIKASAGGGGKGMRVVNNAGEFDQKLEACRRESRVSFVNDRLLLERFLPSSRHVEIQVFADTQGNVVHIFERDCSIQRRFQKVLEEAPAPGLSQQLRQQMGQAAVNATRTINYVGAGTVEFLLQPDGSFYFMEMNTRLQVEHPVTEMISGQDLVEWQLLVASGLPLPLEQADLEINGHAIEVRIYAEDVQRDFMPATGKLNYLQLPVEDNHVRVETGVRQGDEVNIFYDPMIAKLIVWDKNRELALQRMRSALSAFHIMGLKTNISFLSSLCTNDAFVKADLDTNFISKHQLELIANQSETPDQIIVIGVLYLLHQQQALAAIEQAKSTDPYSPWGLVNGWRMNQDNVLNMVFQLEDKLLQVVTHYRQNGGYLVKFSGAEYLCSIEKQGDDKYQVDLGDRQLKAIVQRYEQMISIIYQHHYRELTIINSHQDDISNERLGSGLTAPMPGSVIDIKVSVGDEVKKGHDLMVIEAMKMEHTITAPDKGTIEAIHFVVGDQVEEGDELLSISS